jgi:hypothetical protein
MDALLVEPCGVSMAAELVGRMMESFIRFTIRRKSRRAMPFQSRGRPSS